MSRIGDFADDDAAGWIVKSPDIGTAMAGFTHAVYTKNRLPMRVRELARMVIASTTNAWCARTPATPRVAAGHRRGPLRPRRRVADLARLQRRRSASRGVRRTDSPPTTPACATTRTSGSAAGEHFDDELLTDLALSCAMWFGMGRMLRTLDIGQSCKITL